MLRIQKQTLTQTQILLPTPTHTTIASSAAPMPFQVQLGWGTVFNLILLFFVALYVAGRLPTLFNM